MATIEQPYRLSWIRFVGRSSLLKMRMEMCGRRLGRSDKIIGNRWRLSTRDAERRWPLYVRKRSSRRLSCGQGKIEQLLIIATFFIVSIGLLRFEKKEMMRPWLLLSNYMKFTTKNVRVRSRRPCQNGLTSGIVCSRREGTWKAKCWSFRQCSVT